MNIYQMARLAVELEILAEKFGYDFHGEGGQILWPILDQNGDAVPGEYMLRMKSKEVTNENAA